MAANTGERTLIPAIIPPGSACVNTVFMVGGCSVNTLVSVLCAASSLLSDLFVRTTPTSNIYLRAFNRLARLKAEGQLGGAAILRGLRLNCLTEAYADLWAECWDPAYATDSWALDRTTTPLEDVGPEWTPATPLRRDIDRRQAQVEIDALVALSLGVTADELCTVYRTQFAVLRGYDKDKYLYDANGRIVPTPILQKWRKNDHLSAEDRTHTNAAGNTYTYEPPFVAYDREADMRAAYAVFQSRLDLHAAPSKPPDQPDSTNDT